MKAFKFKLYNSKHNRKLMRRIDVAVCVYNHCIALHKRYYKLFGRHLQEALLKKHITKLKKRRKFAFWNELGSQAIQDVVERIERGYRLFFKNRKKGIKSAPPSFKKRRKYKSFTLKQAGWKYDGGNRIKIGKKNFRFFKSRDIEGIIKTLTIKRDSCGDMFVIFACDVADQVPSIARTGKAVGMDFGLKKFLTASDGNDVISPLFLHEDMDKVRKANRRLSRKRQGAKNRKRAKLDLARLHRDVRARRSDFHWKLALRLVRAYDVICIEDLNLKAMQKLYGRKVGDLGFAEFVSKLQYLAGKYGKNVVQVGRFFASSQICGNCGEKNPLVKNLRVREWVCPACGARHDRDGNAARNILREGLRILSGQGIVRKESFRETAVTRREAFAS